MCFACPPAAIPAELLPSEINSRLPTCMTQLPCRCAACTQIQAPAWKSPLSAAKFMVGNTLPSAYDHRQCRQGCEGQLRQCSEREARTSHALVAFRAWFLSCIRLPALSSSRAACGPQSCHSCEAVVMQPSGSPHTKAGRDQVLWRAVGIVQQCRAYLHVYYLVHYLGFVCS